MHLVARDLHRMDAQDDAVDLAQPRGDIVCLSFSDSDLAAIAAAHARRTDAPSLRLANLAQLKHPFSIDLYLEKTLAHARFVLVRCLGGADYWSYGLDEVAALCREKAIPLAVLPGDARADARLDRASTLPTDDLLLLWRFLDEGGPDNVGNLLGWIETHLGRDVAWSMPTAVPAAGRVPEASRAPVREAGRALIVVYRSLWLAADIAPAVALADALAKDGFAVETLFVTSLKDPRVADVVADTCISFAPHVILNTTAFSARDGGGGVLDRADCAVIQAPFATLPREAWDASPRGLGAIDLAMNVVLPEIDGRIIGTPISFKAPANDGARASHAPHEEGIASVVALARGWTKLRRTPHSERKLALILSDYPLKGGREGYAVGLDSLASVDAIVMALRDAGYAIADLPSGRALIAALSNADITISLNEYARWRSALPKTFNDSINAAWGTPQDDPNFRDEALHLRALIVGNILIGFQPNRGAGGDRRESYHDAAAPPRHSYVAFYLWLQHAWCADAIVHLGTHGTLEWLPGKSVALSRSCAPSALTAGTPVIYPFIVNDPGEAAQARRRIGAVTIGHMTPPLDAVSIGDAEREIEALLDEYAAASGLDPRRAALIADAIFSRATETGLAAESGITPDTSRDESLQKLDAWLCDLKDLRLGDGLHVFGRDAPGEFAGLLAALDGRFVEPGPAGAPSRARQDVLPTGRNLFGIDPRAVPSRTAFAIGTRAADAVLTRFVQDQGDWPGALMIDLWGSSTMRTGGEDFAQALALMGVRPVWDAASSRVGGFEVRPEAELGRPRVDITLRISGLFRDTFPALLDLFDQAVQAVGTLEEADDVNPLAAARRNGDAAARIFGAAPGAYGTGIANRISADPTIAQNVLGESWLSSQAHGFTKRASAPDHEGFARRVADVDALLHTQDMAETDVLMGAAFAEEEGGFAAAKAALGKDARVYHIDATREDATKVRTLAEEVARVARGKFGHGKWIAGLMRHGHRGGGEIAEAVGNLTAFAITAKCVSDATFDLVFDATLGNDTVRAFLEQENPAAAASIKDDLANMRHRGLWICRRNSVAALLDGARVAA